MRNNKNSKKYHFDKPLILLSITAVLLTVIGFVMITVSVNRYISLNNKSIEVTETIYDSIPENAKPIDKQAPEETTNYEQPANTPPIKLLDVPYITQTAKYPSGCESVSAVMALNYAGYKITPEEFIDNYLPKASVPYTENGKCFGYNPSKVFLGDPYSKKGWGCYFPVIGRCLNQIIDKNSHNVVNLHNATLGELCHYIDNDTPVIIWATQGMSSPKKSQSWTLIEDGSVFTWVSPNHCLLFVGYDDTGYYFNDPLTHKNCRYPADIVEKRYSSMGKQALAIVRLTEITD